MRCAANKKIANPLDTNTGSGMNLKLTDLITCNRNYILEYWTEPNKIKEIYTLPSRPPKTNYLIYQLQIRFQTPRCLDLSETSIGNQSNTWPLGNYANPFNSPFTIKLKTKYQKWMKTRPRLKAPDMYATGYETKKGSPNNICVADIHQDRS